VTLRVVDAGTVSAVRSQALWHGLAEAMAPGDDPVLLLCSPSEPYVCVGYHRRLDELDLGECAASGLPVLRRMIGGGPVYLDSDQLFFGLVMPAEDAPAGVVRLYAELLEPAAVALRWLGVPAEVASTNDIVAAGRKISGTGAGQIGDGVVVVGNVMFAFPHERMASVLALPDEAMRKECLRLMREHVGALPQLDSTSVRGALRRAYSTALGRRPLDVAPAGAEEAAISAWERRLLEPEWLTGPVLPASCGRQVKIRAGVWMYDGAQDGVRVRISVERDRVRRADIEAPSLNGTADGIASALLGVAAHPHALAACLEEFGEDGARVLAALSPGLVVR
jgi:lipoate-protein ligase A